ncbi:MAG: hypothetical protein RBT16_02950 [Desulfococcus multivorans]|nr:hypothetical protein [Desulfococcus multivorans]
MTGKRFFAGRSAWTGGASIRAFGTERVSWICFEGGIGETASD